MNAIFGSIASAASSALTSVAKTLDRRTVGQKLVDATMDSASALLQGDVVNGMPVVVAAGIAGVVVATTGHGVYQAMRYMRIAKPFVGKEMIVHGKRLTAIVGPMGISLPGHGVETFLLCEDESGALWGLGVELLRELGEDVIVRDADISDDRITLVVEAALGGRELHLCATLDALKGAPKTAHEVLRRESLVQSGLVEELKVEQAKNDSLRELGKDLQSELTAKKALAGELARDLEGTKLRLEEALADGESTVSELTTERDALRRELIQTLDKLNVAMDKTDLAMDNANANALAFSQLESAVYGALEELHKNATVDATALRDQLTRVFDALSGKTPDTTPTTEAAEATEAA